MEHRKQLVYYTYRFSTQSQGPTGMIADDLVYNGILMVYGIYSNNQGLVQGRLERHGPYAGR